jgi:hypothetical protein
MPTDLIRPITSGLLKIRKLSRGGLKCRVRTYRNLRSSAKRQHPTSAPRLAIIGTADIFTHLVELHQKQRRFLKEIARNDN